MTYTPKLEDFQDLIKPPDSQNSGGYIPKLEDFEDIAPKGMIDSIREERNKANNQFSNNDKFSFLKNLNNRLLAPAITLRDISNFGKHAFADVSDLGRDVINIPSGLLRTVGVNVPNIEDNNIDYYKNLGIQKNGWDSLAKFIATSNPLSRGIKAAGLLKDSPRILDTISSAIASGLLANEGETAKDAGTSAVLSGVTHGAFSAATPVLKYAAREYAQSPIKRFTDLAKEKISQLGDTSDYSKKLATSFLKARDKNSKNWMEVNKLADYIDSNKSIPFNNDIYQNYIDKYISDINKLSPSKKVPYEQSLKLAERAKETAPQSISDILNEHQNLNANLQKFLDPTGLNKIDRYSKDLIDKLKSHLRNETLDKNLESVPSELKNNFNEMWENANKSHAFTKDFEEGMSSATGIVDDDNTLSKMFNNIKSGNSKNLDPSVFARFAPPLTDKRAQGIEGIKALSKLFGNNQDSRNAIKSFIFDKAIDKGANTVDTAAIYSKLSKQQRRALFGNSEEGKLLESINNTRKIYGREPEKTLKSVLHPFSSWAMPAILGGGASYYSSGGDLSNALESAAAASSIAKGLPAAFGRYATPESIKNFIKYSKSEPFKRYSQYVNNRVIQPSLSILNNY